MSRPSSAQPANLATTERIKSGKQIHSARVSSAKSDKKVTYSLYLLHDILILNLNLIKNLGFG